jgi:hypothetical protein
MGFAFRLSIFPKTAAPSEKYLALNKPPISNIDLKADIVQLLLCK